MWCIKAHPVMIIWFEVQQRKFLWPHGQSTSWICLKTCCKNPRQDGAWSDFDANFPDDPPLSCFIPPRWRLTASIYSWLMKFKVNWDGSNIKYEPHLISEKCWVDYLIQRKQEWVVSAIWYMQCITAWCRRSWSRDFSNAPMFTGADLYNYMIMKPGYNHNGWKA